MELPPNRPAIVIADGVVDGDGWQVVDALAWPDEAAVVDLRRGQQRQLVVCIAQGGDWPAPSLLPGPDRVPDRRPVTDLMEPLGQLSTSTVGGAVEGRELPAPGDLPNWGWLTVHASAGADVDRVRVTTSLDVHEAPVRADGSFLVLLRAGWRELPGFELRRDGVWEQVHP